MLKKIFLVSALFGLSFSFVAAVVSTTNDASSLSQSNTGTVSQNVMATLKTPKDILNYMNSNFRFVNKVATTAMPPDALMNSKNGGEQDFAVFADQTLRKNNYLISFVFVYEYIENNQKKNRFLTVFNDNGTPKYFHFNSQGTHLVENYGRNFLELCLKEQERTGLKITRYGTIAVNSLTLAPLNWENFSVEVPVQQQEVEKVQEKEVEQVQEKVVVKEVPTKVESAQELTQYLNENFQITERTGTVVDARDFAANESKRGEQDFAVLIAQNLSKNNITSVILNYRYISDNKQEKDKYVVSFSEKGQAKYIYFDEIGARTVENYGNSFIDLLSTEQERAMITIARYGIISPFATNLVPVKWSEFIVPEKKETVREEVKPVEKPVEVKPVEKPTTSVPEKPVIPLREIAQGQEAVKVYQEESRQGIVNEERKREVKEIIQELAVKTEEEAEKIEEIEDPRVEGVDLSDVYEIVEVMVVEKVVREDGKEDAKKITFSGKGPPDSIVFIFIYSTPIIAKVRTDSQGNWTYTLEKELEDGTHEMYVASVDNTGRIVAKSNPVPLVKEAAAVQIGFTLSPILEPEEQGFFGRNLFFVLLIIFLLIVFLAVIFVGMSSDKKEPRNV